MGSRQRRQVGVVGALWRYPIKSMRGEPLAIAELTEHGLAGDREWALRETEYGGVVSARAWPAMLELRASLAGSERGAVRIEFPDGAAILLAEGEEEAVARRLSAFLRRGVKLERVRREAITAAEREAIIRGEMMPPARDFFDEEVVHLIATGTLAHLRALGGGASDFDPRRFRANVVADTGGDAHGFVEDGWLDGILRIGADAAITGMRPALRCAITTHPQEELAHDPAILRTAWRFHQAYAGIFAAAGAEGTIRVGDPIHLERGGDRS